MHTHTPIAEENNSYLFTHKQSKNVQNPLYLSQLRCLQIGFPSLAELLLEEDLIVSGKWNRKPRWQCIYLTDKLQIINKKKEYNPTFLQGQHL